MVFIYLFIFSDVTLTDYEDDIVSACEELVADEFTNDFNSQWKIRIKNLFWKSEKVDLVWVGGSEESLSVVGGVVFSSGQTWQDPGLVSLFPEKFQNQNGERNSDVRDSPLFPSPTSCVSATTTTTTTRPRRTSSSTTTPTSPTPTTPADTSPTRRYSEKTKRKMLFLFDHCEKEKVTGFFIHTASSPSSSSCTSR